MKIDTNFLPVLVYVWAIAVLIFKMLIMSLLTGFVRHKAGAPATPEDAKFHKTSYDESKASSEPESVARVRRSHQNDLESILPFALAVFIFFQTFPGNINSWCFTALVVIFVFLRVLYTVFYQLSLQPFRSIIWGLSMLVVIIITIYAMVLSVYNVFSTST